MRIFLGIIFLTLIIGVFSCHKQNEIESPINTPVYVTVPDSGELSVDSGTIAVQTPDTTIVFSAPTDAIYFQTGYYNKQAVFAIVAIQPYNNSNFGIGTIMDRKSGATSTLGNFMLDEDINNRRIHYYNTMYGGPYTVSYILNTYNSNGTLAKGSFSALLPRDGFMKHQQQVTGTFDLKLNRMKRK